MEVEPAEVARLLKENTIKLLDVRTSGEYAIAHIDGGVLVDQALVNEIMTSWPKDTPIVTLCHHGIRSLDAAAFLRANGFTNVRSMRGGIAVWSAVVDPKFAAYAVELKDGRVWTGVITQRDSGGFELRDAKGDPHKVTNTEIEQLKPQRVSLMPEGLMKDLTLQDAADLLAFLELLK